MAVNRGNKVLAGNTGNKVAAGNTVKTGNKVVAGNTGNKVVHSHSSGSLCGSRLFSTLFSPH